MMDSDKDVSAGNLDNEPELAQIAELCAGTVRFMNENGLNYIYMEGLRYLSQGIQRQMNALLCLNYTNGTYPTKLYLAENIGLGLNWNETAYLLGQPWFSWSWKGVAPNQKPIEILAAHLEAFR